MKKTLVIFFLLFAMTLSLVSCGAVELKPKNPKNPSENLSFVSDVILYSDPSKTEVTVTVESASVEDEVFTSTETYTKTKSGKKSTITLAYSYELLTPVEIVNGQVTGGTKTTKTGTVVANEKEIQGNYSYVTSPRNLEFGEEDFDGEISVKNSGTLYTYTVDLNPNSLSSIFQIEMQRVINSASISIVCDANSYKIVELKISLDVQNEENSFDSDIVNIMVKYFY